LFTHPDERQHGYSKCWSKAEIWGKVTSSILKDPSPGKQPLSLINDVLDISKTAGETLRIAKHSGMC
jgi:hypothetical protein